MVYREFFSEKHSEKFPISKGLDALFFHETEDTVISVLIESDEELLKFRHFLFRNDQHTAALRNEIVVCKQRPGYI